MCESHDAKAARWHREAEERCAPQPRRGRPPTHEDPADVALPRVRVSQRERFLAEHAAACEGRTLSAWVRVVVRRAVGIGT